MSNETITISGKIDTLFSHLPSGMRKDELLNGMINRPIMNCDKVVGVITDYDLEAGFWYGRIWVDSCPFVTNNYICSIELKH